MIQLGVNIFYENLPMKIFVVCIHVINFKEASGRFFFHFLEVFEKSIKYIRIFFISGRFQNFGTKCYILEKFYGSFPGVSRMIREVSHVWVCPFGSDRDKRKQLCHSDFVSILSRGQLLT